MPGAYWDPALKLWEVSESPAVLQAIDELGLRSRVVPSAPGDLVDGEAFAKTGYTGAIVADGKDNPGVVAHASDGPSDIAAKERAPRRNAKG